MDAIGLKDSMQLTALFSTGENPLWIVTGAFAGSIIFIVAATEHSQWIKFALFTASMITGFLSADCMASMMSYIISKYFEFSFSAPSPVGALVSSAISVRALMYVSKKHDKSVLLLEKFVKGIKK
ncbi:putative holin [Klebsiella oxytoca]|uniref:putative holin n=1 Tax=Klebsiella oxytoca TaxID=571 RepID=UPI001CC9C413|nr:putative holin [Klebsiella oxytoca]MBZ7309041.1 hypothetical protein [Klebsiella oxytoca]